MWRSPFLAVLFHLKVNVPLRRNLLRAGANLKCFRSKVCAGGKDFKGAVIVQGWSRSAGGLPHERPRRHQAGQ